MKGYQKALALLLCGLLLLVGCTRRESAGGAGRAEGEEDEAQEEIFRYPADLSFETVTGHITLQNPQELIVTRPSMDFSMYGETYYLTGCSDPTLPLLLDGEEVEYRGIGGSFGVFVELEPGDNVFTFSQGEMEETVTITRTEEAEPTYTSTLTELYPSGNVVVRAVEELTLDCRAPAGSTVTVEFRGETLELEQYVAEAAYGVSAYFYVDVYPEDLEGVEELGPLTYTLEWEGETTQHTSSGTLYLAGSQAEIIVQVEDVSIATFLTEDDEGGFYTTLQSGAVDTVEEIGGSMYRLRDSRWVMKSSVNIQTEPLPLSSTVSGAHYNAGEKVETLTLSGTATPPYRMEAGEDTLILTLFRTTGVDAEMDLGDSALFTEVAVLEEEGNTVLTFQCTAPGLLRGYTVDYNGNDTVVRFARVPELEEGEQPLTGITVALDPGHGGSDGGGESVARNDGHIEKEITIQTAMAVQKYLNGLGAHVILLRENDDHVSLDQRLADTQQDGVDVMVSLHCNSMSYANNGTLVSGVEIYYYDPGSLRLAEKLLEHILEETGRDSRNVRHDYYRVTLNSYAPTVMVEMGFMTNPVEYDQLWDKEQIYATAKAIGEGIVDTLSPDPEPAPEVEDEGGDQEEGP